MGQELAGKVAIITGGASGIGRASVELFVEEGAKVVFADVNESLGAEVEAGLGGAARFKRTDVSKVEEVQALVDFAVSEFGRLDVMFNNAGISDRAHGPFLDNRLANFQDVMAINLLGVMWGTQCAARQMIQSGGGSIINTSSMGALRPGASTTVYRASKAGVIHFTQCMAVEFGAHLIRVNCICPGLIPTPMTSFNDPAFSPEANQRIREAEHAGKMTGQPLKRPSTARDIAQAAMFLGSDRARQISGVILPVDGGVSAGSSDNLGTAIVDARNAAIEAEKALMAT